MDRESARGAMVGRIGADRMALGLRSIPDPLHGDMETVKDLRAEVNEKTREVAIAIDEVETVNKQLQAARADNDAYADMLRKERAEVERLREQRERKFDEFLEWRGVEPGNQCKRCSGAGSYMYGSTATWVGGIGGQAMTLGVCNKCWGSGDSTKPWANLRDMQAAIHAARGAK